jgi:Domain of Unknown Function (DUF1080)
VKNLIHIAGLSILSLLISVSCQKSGQQQQASETPKDTVAAGPILNELTAEEKTSGWELLFDGKTLNGWKRYNADSIGPLWSVKDSAIMCDGSGFTEGTAKMGGSLMTTRTFGNFELRFEWKLSPGGNSGVLYHIIEKPEFKHDYETGPEYQVMDDGGWKDKLHPAQKVGSNYDMFPAPDTKKVNPVGEWNTGGIKYNNGHVEQWLNGEKVVEFDEGSPQYMENYKKSKWTKYPAWNKSKVGAISLQDHGAPVYFRNIKIKVL